MNNENNKQVTAFDSNRTEDNNMRYNNQATENQIPTVEQDNVPEFCLGLKWFSEDDHSETCYDAHMDVIVRLMDKLNKIANDFHDDKNDEEYADYSSRDIGIASSLLSQLFRSEWKFALRQTEYLLSYYDLTGLDFDFQALRYALKSMINKFCDPIQWVKDDMVYLIDTSDVSAKLEENLCAASDAISCIEQLGIKFFNSSI